MRRRLHDTARSRRRVRDIRVTLYAAYDRLKFLLQFLVEVFLDFHIVGAMDFLVVGVRAILAAINSPVATIRLAVELNAAESAFHKILLTGFLR